MSAISSERGVLPSARWRRWPLNWAMRVIIHWKCREMIQILRALDDWQLRDMGLTRHQIEAAVYARYQSDFARFR